jgi:hypothetical protein
MPRFPTVTPSESRSHRPAGLLVRRAGAFVLALALALPLTLSIPDGMASAYAQGQGQGQGKGKDRDVQATDRMQQEDPDVADILQEGIIDASEEALVRDYFRDNPPQGLKGLPPGIAKNVERGKPLPPGIAKRYLPQDLERQLAEREPSIGTIVDAVIVGDDVAIVEQATGVIVDIIRGIGTGE